MNPKEKAIEYCKRNRLVVPFFSKKVNRIFDGALNIAIKEAKKEVFDDIKILCTSIKGINEPILLLKHFGELQKKHLNTPKRGSKS